jgi:hypothetical protein
MLEKKLMHIKARNLSQKREESINHKKIVRGRTHPIFIFFDSAQLKKRMKIAC